MICLADNDLIWKLASFDLIGEALSLLGIQENDVQILPTAHIYFSNPRHRTRIEELCLPVTLARIDSFLSRVQVVQLPYDAQDLSALNVPNIDPGERVFLAVIDTTCRIATGDRNCLRALTKEALKSGGRIASLHNRWQGRIVWLDQLVLAAAIQDSSILAKVWRGSACDMGIFNAFHSEEQTPVADVINVLDRRVTTVRRETNGLLAIL